MAPPTGEGPPGIPRRHAGGSRGDIDARELPATDLEFTRAERLRLELPVASGTQPGTARMLDRAGNELHVPVRFGQKTHPATGQRWITADIVLAPLAAGGYAIEQAPAGMEKVITAIRVTW